MNKTDRKKEDKIESSKENGKEKSKEKPEDKDELDKNLKVKVGLKAAEMGFFQIFHLGFFYLLFY